LELVPSVALFLDRSRAAGRELALDRKRLEAVAHICTRLDGLPLAIELAAAQTLAFSPEQIAEHLRERLPLPTRTATSGVERQQTMQRALDWSYELLSEPQQRLVEACGVFGGPWTVEALQSLSPEVADIPAGLARLVEHSLVAVVDAPGDRRYRLLGPVREYALARLERSGRLMEAQDRHARHYREVARQIGRPAWDEALTPLAIRRLEADHDNFLAALARADAAGDVDSTRRLTELLWPFWRRTGRLYLGYERFKQLVAMDHLAPAHKGFAYSGLANFTQLLGDRAEASALARTALAHYRDAGLIPGEIVATGMLAEIAAEGGDYEEARRRYREAIAIAPEGPAGEWIVALARLGLGFTEYWAGNFDESESLLNQGLAALRSRASWHVGLAHLRIGGIARQRGALDKALEEGRLGLRLVHKLGGGQEVAHALEELSATELALCRLTRAATLLGSASILRETTRSTPAPADEHAVKAAHTATRNGLGESTFTAAWVNGRASTREIAVAYALSDSSASDRRVAPLASLTSRESEVARLVAKGLSNAQIAAQLVISDATARTHVERIRSKLGVHSRTQIARVVMGAPSDP
ncbi:MAG: ATP-binding protein, partial [Tepidiformaceae bacterium]